MKIGLFSLVDAKMAVYLAPFPARNEVEASRQLKAAMRDPQMKNADFVMTPADFALVRVADFDDESGLVSPSTERTSVNLSLLADSTVTP